MGRTGFTSVSVRDDVAEKIDKFIQSNEEGFTNRAQFLTAAVHKFLETRVLDRQNVNPVNDAIIEAQIASHVKELADKKFEGIVAEQVEKILREKFGA